MYIFICTYIYICAFHLLKKKNREEHGAFVRKVVKVVVEKIVCVCVCVCVRVCVCIYVYIYIYIRMYIPCIKKKKTVRNMEHSIEK